MLCVPLCTSTKSRDMRESDLVREVLLQSADTSYDCTCSYSRSNYFLVQFQHNKGRTTRTQTAKLVRKTVISVLFGWEI